MQFKVLLLGNASVGKTCLFKRFFDDAYDEDRTDATIGVDFKIKSIPYTSGKGNEYEIKLQLWDTSGQDKYRALTKQYYRGSQGAIIVYDITDKDSFVAVKDWIDTLRNHINEADCIVFLVGNKSDLVSERQVDTMEAREFAK